MKRRRKREKKNLLESAEVELFVLREIFFWSVAAMKLFFDIEKKIPDRLGGKGTRQNKKFIE